MRLVVAAVVALVALVAALLVREGAKPDWIVRMEWERP